MNEGVVLLANAVEELLRHVSSLRSTGVDIIIEIITKLASLGEGKCSESSSGEGVNTAMETDSNDKTNEGHDLVSVMDPNADGISGEQFVQLCIFHVMVLVHRTMENSETCRLFVEKGGIEILLKLLLRPSITQSSEGMPIALHSTLVFKGFTQHHSVPLARAFCFSLRDHLKRALGGFRSVAGSFLLAQQTTMDAESFSSLFVVEFLLFLAASKDNRWISTLLTEFGDSNKDVLEDIGRLQREVLWQVALLQGSELEKELESTESSNDVQKTNASTNESDDQRFSSFRQYLDPLLREGDIGRVTGGSRRTGSENYFSSRFSNRQQNPGNSSDLSVDGKTEDEKRRSYYSLCRDMMRSLSYHCNLLFMELGKAMLLASRRENNPAVLPSSVVSVATVVSSIMSDHLTFRGYVNPSESDVSISTKCRYLGKVVDFVDGVLTDRPESCNPIVVNCLYSCGVIQAILTTFEATSQLLLLSMECQHLLLPWRLMMQA
ncbi:hypothetical protein HPP92_024234 [Vanilla planifolia]|uniref:DUF913 domain-containing protein n=1 Tax=Vanilla planifolia TaxID=51239 RepID=A0A835UEH6_VANPL|nr:hypothetical protein HPP92_024234 [Vanilla planifolia]